MNATASQLPLFDERTVKKIDGDFPIVKENTIIRSNYDLNLYEHRVLAVVASQIKPTDAPGQNYFFRVADFAEYFKLDSRNIYTIIKETLLKLRSRSFVIKRPKEKERITGWINWAELIPSSGCVEVSIDDRIRPYFLDIKAVLGYTKYQLKYVRNFQNPYAFRFYERFKAELQDKRKVKLPLSIDELKKWLAIEDQYKLYGDLKKRVIVPALEDINGKNFDDIKSNRKRKFKLGEGSDIEVSFEENKPGRKVIGITFEIVQIIFNESEKEFDGETIDVELDNKFDLSDQEQVAYNDFLDKGVEEKTIQDAIQRLGSGSLVYMINYLKKMKPVDPKSYAIAILQNGWGFPKNEADKKKLDEDISLSKAANEIVDSLKEVAGAISDEEKEKADAYINTLTVDEKKSLAIQCQNFLKENGYSLVDGYKVESAIKDIPSMSKMIFQQYIVQQVLSDKKEELIS